VRAGSSALNYSQFKENQSDGNYKHPCQRTARPQLVPHEWTPKKALTKQTATWKPPFGLASHQKSGRKAAKKILVVTAGPKAFLPFKVDGDRSRCAVEVNSGNRLCWLKTQEFQKMVVSQDVATGVSEP